MAAFAGAACLVTGSEIVHTQGALSAVPSAVTPTESDEEAPRRLDGALVVIPFANVSGLAEDDWLGVGIAETLTADLGAVGDVSVLPRDTFDAVIGESAPADAEAVARDLARDRGVSWLVSGAFQRQGDRLRITARIVEVETGTAREQVTVDGDADEIFALQDEVVAALVGGLGPETDDPETDDMDGAGRASDAPVATTMTTTATTMTTTEPDTPPAPAQAAASGVSSGPPRGQGRRAGAIRGFGGLGAGSGSGGGSEGEGDLFQPVTAVPDRAGGRLAPRPASEVVTGRITVGDPAADFVEVPAVGDAGALTGRKTVRPVPTRTPPAVDGRLDDEVWRDAAVISDFVQREPLDGEPATEDTDVYVAYDSTNLYFAFHAKYDDVTMMRANRVDRDRADRGDDIIRVYLDTFLDQQRAYVFSVNGYGVQGDSIVGGARGGGFGGGGGRGGGGGPGGGIPRGDSSWDALFETGGQLVEDGFTAEMAIPFKSLRYPVPVGCVAAYVGLPGGPQHPGQGRDRGLVAVLPRHRRLPAAVRGARRDDRALDQPQSRAPADVHRVSASGRLDETTGRVVDADPDPEVGANFKYGLTSNLTADVTLNPDFSQIESDRPQVEVNQRFALFFPELRPFFLEGAEIFQIQAPVNAVHTRTIVDPLYGAKLTGKAGDTQIGVLYANDEAPGKFDDPLNPGYDKSAQTFVGRARYDLYPESYVGAIVTDREFLDGHSRLIGFDSNFRDRRDPPVRRAGHADRSPGGDRWSQRRRRPPARRVSVRHRVPASGVAI